MASSLPLTAAEYINSLLWIRNKAGKVIPFRQNVVQRKIQAAKKRAILAGKPWRFLVPKARRMGVTTQEQALSFALCANFEGQRAITLAATRDQTRDTFKISNLFYKKLPPEIRPAREHENRSALVFTNPASEFFIGTAGAAAIARGDTLQRVHGCLAPDTPVLLADGTAKPISSFSPGDAVLTHSGAFATVTAVTEKRAADVPGKGSLVTIRPWLSQAVSLTPDHEVFTNRGWIRADALTLSDRVSFPLRPITSEMAYATIPLPSTPPRPQGGGSQRAPGSLELNEETGFFCGYYLAEGSIIRAGINLSRHITETDYAQRAYNAVSHIATSRNIKPLGEGAKETVYSSGLAEWIAQEFGATDQKRVPDWAFRAGPDFARGLLAGYLAGDGSKFQEPTPRIKATSICSRISFPIRDLAASLGYGWASISRRPPRLRHGRQEREAWELSWSGTAARALRALIGLSSPPGKGAQPPKWEIKDGYIWLPIRSIGSSRATHVWDLAVDHPDHSFRTAYFSVSNSEVAFWLANRQNQEQEIENIMAGLTEAASHGEVTLESTANGDAGWWYETVTEAALGRNEWTVIFLPWWEDPTYRVPVKEPGEILSTLSDREKWLMEDKGLDVQQIAWRRGKTSERALRRVFLQEYPEKLEESFLSSSLGYFDADILDFMDANTQEPRADGGGICTWVDPEPGLEYVIGADVAEGVPEGDYSAAYVLERRTGAVCARFHGKQRPEDFADTLYKMGKRYNWAMLGPERNNHGHLTVYRLRANLGYPHIYYTLDLSDTKQVGAHPRHRILWGFSTDNITRPTMLDDLRGTIEDGWNPKCGILLNESRTFVDNGKGKYEARSGKHDDTVMAMAIALQVRANYPAPPGIS